MMTWISCSLVREPSKRRHANEIGEPENKSAYIRFQFFSFFRPRRKGESELVSLTLALLTGRRREILVKRTLDWCLKHTDTVVVFFVCVTLPQINLRFVINLCLVAAPTFDSELLEVSSDQQSASNGNAEGGGADKKLVDYQVGEEVNCYVKSVRDNIIIIGSEDSCNYCISLVITSVLRIHADGTRVSWELRIWVIPIKCGINVGLLWFCLTSPYDWSKKNTHHFFHQLDPKPIATRLTHFPAH